MPGPPAPRELPGPDLVPAEEALANMQRALTAEANARPFHPRETPHLVERPDGSLAWRGENFGVVIRPDGEIEFSDEDDLQYDWRTGDGSFCLECAFMDPYAAEREWFVEATAAVREEREDRARAEREARALRRLTGRLASLWQDPTRSPRERRRALFELWDEAAEDERGRAAREAVLAFVRESLPAGSDEAFSGPELAQLNGARDSHEPFAPY
jgi:hypothetical protein